VSNRPPGSPAISASVVLPVEASSGRETKIGGVDANIAAVLCYLPVFAVNLVASCVFLATEPKESRFVRFHAIQSLLLDLGGFLLFTAVSVATVGVAWLSAFFRLETVGLLLSALMSLLMLAVSAGLFALLLWTMWQTYKRRAFRIPLLGFIADKLA
jgi:uncharacterized membrane protein